MPITALALLRIPPPSTALRVDPLSDSVLVHTELDFGREPEELADALLDLLGDDVVFAHDDPRGVLFIPSVAAPSAREYEAVVAEVGEGGVWGALPPASAQQGDLGQLLGGMLAQLPPSLLASAQAAVSGNSAELEAMGAQVQSLLGSGGLAGLAAQLQDLTAQEGPLRDMVLGMQKELMRDPNTVEQLKRQLLARDEDEDK